MDDLRLLEQERRRVVVAYPAMTECHALLVKRYGTRLALGWLTEVHDHVILHIPTAGEHAGAANLLARFPDQPLALVDATITVLSERLGIPVWTYDHHFDVMRVAVWR